MFAVLHGVMRQRVMVVLEVTESSSSTNAAFQTVFAAAAVSAQSTAKIISSVAQTRVMKI
jgi:hypothetical protein